MSPEADRLALLASRPQDIQAWLQDLHLMASWGRGGVRAGGTYT